MHDVTAARGQDHRRTSSQSRGQPNSFRVAPSCKLSRCEFKFFCICACCALAMYAGVRAALRLLTAIDRAEDDDERDPCEILPQVHGSSTRLDSTGL